MHFQPPFLPTPLQRKIESYEENTKGAMSGIQASINPLSYGSMTLQLATGRLALTK